MQFKALALPGGPAFSPPTAVPCPKLELKCPTLPPRTSRQLPMLAGACKALASHTVLSFNGDIRL